MKSAIATLSACILITGCITPASIIGIDGTISTENQDDILEPLVIVKSQKYEAPDAWNDFFYRAFVDKKTGETAYQMYFTARSSGWMHWGRLAYELGGELVQTKGDRVGSGRANCNQYGCAYHEDMLVRMERSQLDKIASQASVTFRVTGRVEGAKKDYNVSAKETKLFLDAVDAAASNI